MSAVTAENLPDAQGHFGPYGGIFVAETLTYALQQLRDAYEQCRSDSQFQQELRVHFLRSPAPQGIATANVVIAGGDRFTGLFVDEAPLPGEIQAASSFAEKFAALGPADSKGRSLRQFDLEHRLMRYPCSYMIYSPAFDALPPEAKKLIYARIFEVLSNRFSSADRQAVIEILRETKKDLPL